MFPYQLGGNYFNHSFPFNMNCQTYQPPYPQMNPYAYSYNYQNVVIPHQSGILNYPLISQGPYFADRNHYPVKQQNYPFKKKKRITKKLTLIQIKKQFRNMAKQFKAKKKSFKYFDPSRAPPISSLRNDQQLEMDLKIQEKKSENFFPNDDLANNRTNRDILKLQILLKEPSKKQYPFLICKKRKYYRNLKRRYSVAYFQQRASFINNKLPIPAELHPKNKVRKSRFSNKNTQDNGMKQNSQQYAQSSNSNSSEYSSQCDVKPPESEKKNMIKIEQKNLNGRNKQQQQLSKQQEQNIDS